MATATAQKIQVESAARRFYRPELDVLRFLAFSMVFLSHVAGNFMWADAGILGVPVFFLLSAFLITELLLREKQNTGQIHISSFYVRRILRIWPLYFAALTFGFLFVLPVASRYHLSVKELLFYLFFVGNWWTATHFYLPGGMGPLWSITVEEQFYLIWPLAVKKLGRRGILWIAGTLWIASQITIIGIYHATHPRFILLWTNTANNLQYFALVIALSIILNGRLVSYRMPVRVALGLTALGIFMVCDHLLFRGSSLSMLEALLVFLLAGAVATLLFLSLYGIQLPSYASPLVYLGTVSYGLYVMHVWIWMITGGILTVLRCPQSILSDWH